MRTLIISFLLIFLLQCIKVHGQQDSLINDPVAYAQLVRIKFGRDQDLINGLLSYAEYRILSGHPYLLFTQYVTGDVIVKGQVYENVFMKYNIDSQALEILYSTQFGGDGNIVLVTDFVDGFSFGGLSFRKMNFENDISKFYQDISTSHFNVYKYWQKEPEIHPDGREVEYPRVSGQFYISVGQGEINEFKGLKSFSKLFPNHKKEIKKLFRSSYLSFRELEPYELTKALYDIDRLLNELEAQ